MHTVADIIRFRLLMIAAGYEDGNDATGLRTDPLFRRSRRNCISRNSAESAALHSSRRRAATLGASTAAHSSRLLRFLRAERGPTIVPPPR